MDSTKTTYQAFLAQRGGAAPATEQEHREKMLRHIGNMYQDSLHGTKYPVKEYLRFENPDGSIEAIPLLDIPMLSDYKWQLMALESRLQHRENHAKFEDVDEAILELRQWLHDHAPQAATCGGV